MCKKIVITLAKFSYFLYNTKNTLKRGEKMKNYVKKANLMSIKKAFFVVASFLFVF